MEEGSLAFHTEQQTPSELEILCLGSSGDKGAMGTLGPVCEKRRKHLKENDINKVHAYIWFFNMHKNVRTHVCVCAIC